MYDGKKLSRIFPQVPVSGALALKKHIKLSFLPLSRIVL